MNRSRLLTTMLLAFASLVACTDDSDAGNTGANLDASSGGKGATGGGGGTSGSTGGTGSSGTSGSSGAGAGAQDGAAGGASDAGICEPDAATGCQGLTEEACNAHGAPCKPLMGKLIQTGVTEYAGCYSYLECVDGAWVGKAPGQSQSCGQDPTRPNECWLFNMVYAPDGWTVDFLCEAPACAGAFGNADK